MARPRDLALGYAGGLLLAGLASWLRVAMTGSLGVDVYHPAFFVSSGLSGVGLGVASFCALRLLAAAGSVPRARIVRWALVANLVLVLAVPLTSTDLFTYLGLGRMQAQGANPFAVPMSATDMGPLADLVPRRWADLPTVYGPLAILTFRAAAFAGTLVGSPLWGGAVAVKLTMAACQVAFILLAARHVRRHRPGEDGARTLVLASFCPLLAWEVTGQAHNDGILCVALMLFVAAAVEGRALAAVLVLAAGTYVKMTLAPLLALYLLFLLRTRGARAVLHALAAAALGALLMVPFLRGLGAGAMASSLQAVSPSHSLGDFFYNVLAPLGPAVQGRAVSATFALCVVVSAVAFGNALRARTVPGLLHGALIFLLAWDMTVPMFQPWYVTWLFPLAVAEADERWQRLVVVYAVLSALSWIAPIDPFSTMALNGYVIWRMATLLRGAPAGLTPAVPAAPPADPG